MFSQRIIKEGALQAEPTRFVIVDDNEALLHLWKRVFSMERNCSCLLTSSPAQALQEIEVHGADILLTDFEMPEMNGLELATQVKALSPQTRIFFTTGEIGLLEKHGQAFGKLEVIQKPYANIFNIQSFIHQLANHFPLNAEQRKTQGSFLVWNF